MAYSAAVERWRPIVEKYFPPELVDKALYVINGESGGNPTITGDGGVAIGLFQIHDGSSIKGRPSKQELSDPEFNIRYAAQNLGAANGSWGAWGENNLYNGKPFGALGMHPYPGTVTNARSPSGVDTSGAVEESGGGYQSTGTFDDDMLGYWQEAEDAYRELKEYQSRSSKPILISDGAVYAYDPDNLNADDEGLVLDPIGTAILQRAALAEAAMDRLDAARSAGLMQSGSDAAKAWVSANKEKVAEGMRKYENYVTRIKDLVALEDIPKQRAMSLATAMDAVNKNRSRGTFNQQGTGMGVSGRPQETDFTGYAQSLKSTIPAEAPPDVAMPESAMTPYSPPPIRMRTPEEILGNAGVIFNLDNPTINSFSNSLLNPQASPTTPAVQTSPSVFNKQGWAGNQGPGYFANAAAAIQNSNKPKIVR